MKNLNTDVFRIYISHPIRGKKGGSATIADMENNNVKAINAGQEIDSYLFLKSFTTDVPVYDIYVPAAHDEFVTIAYLKGMLTIDQILEIDCDILKKCSVLLMYDWEDGFGYGMQKEMDFALANNIPVIIFDRIDDESLEKIANAIGDIFTGNTFSSTNIKKG